jgi:hypothetical protein
VTADDHRKAGIEDLIEQFESDIDSLLTNPESDADDKIVAAVLEEVIGDLKKLIW